MKLNPYMVTGRHPEEGSLPVFHWTKRQAASLGWPELKGGWWDDILRRFAEAKRLEARPDIMDQATSEEPHVISNPRGCPSCEMWGGEPRFGETLCEFCEDGDP